MDRQLDDWSFRIAIRNPLLMIAEGDYVYL